MNVPDHIQHNHTAWNDCTADYVGPGERAWASEPSWEIRGMAETELGLLPDVAGHPKRSGRPARNRDQLTNSRRKEKLSGL